jgi:uncharacterized membrane protein YkoI
MKKRIVLLEEEDARRIIAERYGVEVKDVRINLAGFSITYEVTLKND